MKTYALLRYDLKRHELEATGTYFLPVTAMNMAHGHGARGKWDESPENSLVVAGWRLADEHAKAMWYIAPVEVTPSYAWEAAREVALLLREILAGIARNGARR